MSGNRESGVKTAITNKQKYGEDFYVRIGGNGGRAPYTGKKGFAANPELAKIAGAKGGKISRKNKGE